MKFMRNLPFWIDRQLKGDEIHLTLLGKEIGTLYGARPPMEPGTHPMPGKVIWRSDWARSPRPVALKDFTRR